MMYLFLHAIVSIACALHILLRPNRQPESRAAWLLVVFIAPFLGALIYILFGQTNVGTKRVERLKKAFHDLPRPEGAQGYDASQNKAQPTPQSEPLFRVGHSITGYAPIGGNQARLMKDSDAAIDEMVADIDRAKNHVHLVFYIWLDDHNGNKMADALMRAAKRGVTCRAMVDDIGSRNLVKGELWQKLGEAGVKTHTALRVGNIFYRIFNGRVDLRNHRKILVIDNKITYCGSQNCADPAFLPKAKFAPWVDAVMRFEGPIVRQNQHLFLSDWIGNGGDDCSSVLTEPMPKAQAGFTAQVVGTGPTYRASAMPEMFEALIYAAQNHIFITTPYYVPDAALQSALCACANRGVDTQIIFPARNDDFAVAATSRSYYLALLKAGVKIYEYQSGLLHTKSLTMDDDITLIGSANMDRRSFDLNYENNILLIDPKTTATMRARQQDYLQSCRAVKIEEVENWSMGHRIWNNLMAILGPVL